MHKMYSKRAQTINKDIHIKRSQLIKQVLQSSTLYSSKHENNVGGSYHLRGHQVKELGCSGFVQ